MRDILFRGFAPVETKYTINFIKGTEKAFVNGEWIKGNWVYGDFNRRMSEETEFCITVDFFEDGYDVESYKDTPICFGLRGCDYKAELTGNPYDMDYRRSDCPLRSIDDEKL